jgi:hypothetical protein
MKKYIFNKLHYISFFLFLFFCIFILFLAFTPKLNSGAPIAYNVNIRADLGNISAAISAFYYDDSYLPSAINGECLDTRKGSGNIIGKYLTEGKIPLYPQITKSVNADQKKEYIYFCSKDMPIWYMPWKTKKVGTREYWYKTLSYKGKEDRAYLLCAEVNNKDKLNTKQGVENVQSYEEAKKYMEHYKSPSLSWKETEELMEDYRNNVDVYIYCTLNNLDNT